MKFRKVLAYSGSSRSTHTLTPMPSVPKCIISCLIIIPSVPKCIIAIATLLSIVQPPYMRVNQSQYCVLEGWEGLEGGCRKGGGKGGCKHMGVWSSMQLVPRGILKNLMMIVPIISVSFTRLSPAETE